MERRTDPKGIKAPGPKPQDLDNPRGLSPKELEQEKKLWATIYKGLKANNPNVNDIRLRELAYKAAVHQLAEIKLEAAKAARQELLRVVREPYVKALEELDNPLRLDALSQQDRIINMVREVEIGWKATNAYTKALKVGNEIMAKAIKEYKEALEWIGEWPEV